MNNNTHPIIWGSWKNKPQEIEPKVLVERVAPRVYMERKAREMIAFIDEALDGFYNNDYKGTIDWFQLLKTHKVKAPYVPIIKEHFDPLLAEVEAVSGQNDAQLNEYYRKLSKKQIAAYVNVVSELIANLDIWSGVTKKLRKTRKKKPLSVQSTLKFFNYKESDDEYKIVSIDPQTIIGAKCLWVFNPKYNQIGFYLAEDETGLKIHRSQIRNFSTQNSMWKRIGTASAKAALNQYTALTLQRLWKTLDNKPNGLTGSINKDTILLKAIK